MTSDIRFLAPGIAEYVERHTTRPSELEQRLIDETRQLTYAGMQIGFPQGQFMAMLVKIVGAQRALEIGTFTGYSSICIAAALPEGGELVCCDDSEEWTSIARKYWALAGLDDRIRLELGDAASTLQNLVDAGRQETFDFIFIDADKQNYPLYYEHSLKLLSTGGLIAIDNTLWSGDVADPENDEPGTRAIRQFNEMLQQDNRVDISLVPIGDGLTLARKVAVE